jgi:hypothetical protein
MFAPLSIPEWIFFGLLLVPTWIAMNKGAPFVPTPMAEVRRMLKAAHIKKGEKVYDLGAGDGRLVHLASKEYGARGIGYELSPLVWAWSRLIAPFWKSKAELRFGNFWTKDVSDADVIVIYLLPKSLENFETQILPQLRHGTRIVSHAFPLKSLTPSQKLDRLIDEKLATVWIYTINKSKSQAQHRSPTKPAVKKEAAQTLQVKPRKKTPPAPKASKPKN